MPACGSGGGKKKKDAGSEQGAGATPEGVASQVQPDSGSGGGGFAGGGITPLGLPEDWRVLVDASLLDQPLVVIGSGLRRSKLLVPGPVLADLPRAEVVEGLGR